jgi:hypothetical protein
MTKIYVPAAAAPADSPGWWTHSIGPHIRVNCAICREYEIAFLAASQIADDGTVDHEIKCKKCGITGILILEGIAERRDKYPGWPETRIEAIRFSA